MTSLFRVLAMVAILTLAAAGCEKGKQDVSSKSSVPKKAEAERAASKSGKSHSKAGATEAHGKGEASAKHEASAKREASAKHEAGSRGGKIGVLTAQDDGRDFDLRQGQIVTVVLDSNRSTGMSWAMIDAPGTVIVREGNPVYAPKKGKQITGTETWHFRAAKPGQGTARLEYRRKWAQSVPERTFRFTATVR